MASSVEHFKREMKDICEWKDNKPIISICVDFDGTLCDHQYPRIGKENEHCFEVMCKWTTQYNVGWILDTMRSGVELEQAVKWCEERGMKFYGIGSIDDRNLGVPLIMEEGHRPRVDWKTIDEEYSPLIAKISNNK